MYKRKHDVIKKIREAKRLNVLSLDLSCCNLTEIPKELSTLTKLEELTLYSNKIIDISHLSSLTNLKKLNLGSNKIIDISKLEKLLNLTTLYLHSNEISDISALSKLINLKKLHLYSNKIIDISYISRLTNLLSLNLGRNNIMDIKNLSMNVKLTSLILNYNYIEDISHISNLLKLTTLNLSSNDIIDIDALSKLQNLLILDLSSNKIVDMKNLSMLIDLRSLTLNNMHLTDISYLSELKNLRKLSLMSIQNSNLAPLFELKFLESLVLLGNNLIDQDIEMISNLVNLKELNCGDNNLKDITVIEKLINLKELNLGTNKIINISPLQNLVNLKILLIDDNPITDIMPLFNLLQQNIPILTSMENYKPNKFLIYLRNCPLNNPPFEIVEQGNHAVLRYFKDLETQGAGELNEAKLIIVGEPEAGKSTLMETLVNPDYILNPKSESTLGIEVREGWEFEHTYEQDRIISANIWDFGGQQIQYMTHQFFLTPDSVYILVCTNDRKESTNFPYWFKIIHLLGENTGLYSPVLVVKNKKSDKFHFDFDLTYYQKRYPELQIEVCDVDLNNRKNDFLALRDRVQKLLSSIPLVNEDRPAKWKNIRQDLRIEAKEYDHINFEYYAKICERHGVIEEASQKLLSSYLHRIGSLLHFVNDVSLRDFIILKPQWAVDAVYSVLIDDEISENNGRFKQEKLDNIWKSYKPSERANLLNLMKQENFEICYEVSDEKGLFISPQLLQDTQPLYDFNCTDCLKFRFRYKFMPDGIITRLIVRLNQLIDNNLVWKKGVILTDDNCRAEVLEEENNEGLKVIDITIIGDEQKRKYLLHIIREEIKKIHNKWFKNIESEEMIPCNCVECKIAPIPHFFEHSTLERYQNKGKQTIECTESMEDVNVLALVEGVGISIDKFNKVIKSVKEEIRPSVIVNIVNEKPIIEPLKENNVRENFETIDPFYKKWGFYGIIAGLITSIVLWYFWSETLPSYINLGISLASGYFVYNLNPKRRYLRLAGVIVLWLIFSASPSIAANIGLLGKTQNNDFWFLLDYGKPLNLFISFGFLGLIVWLTWLDSKEK